MKYIFDSDTISYLYNPTTKQHAKVKAKFAQLQDDDVTQISDIILFELEYSYYNADPTKQIEIRTTINDIKTRFQIVPISNRLVCRSFINV